MGLQRRRIGSWAAPALFCIAALLGAGDCLAQGQGTISGVVVGVREDSAGNDSLLLKIPTVVESQPVDEIRLTLPKKVVRDLSPDLPLPAGWTLEKPAADSVVLRGPALPDEPEIRLRLGLGGAPAPKQLGLSLLAGGRPLVDRRVGVDRLPPIQPVESADGVVVTPEIVSPGDLVEFTVLDPRRFLWPGTWSLGGIEAEPATDDEKEDQPEGTSSGGEGQRYKLSVGYDLNWRLGARLRYETEWKEPVLDLKWSGRWMDEVEYEPIHPWISGCTKYAFAGDIICVCGHFPTPESRRGLKIDGRPLGAPLAASDGAVQVRIPGDLSPGWHLVTGTGVNGSADLTVLAVQGSIDQSKLLRGESTELRLGVVGTQEPVEMRLTNNTPGIVRLEGGNDQVIKTSGGKDNAWQGTVHAVSPGDFNIVYVLTLGGCPCEASQLEGLDDQLTSETWFDETRDAYRRGCRMAGDAYYSGLARGRDRRGLAERALRELQRARRKLKKGEEAWEKGDTEGGIGPETAKRFRQFIEQYETLARAALERPVEGPKVAAGEVFDDPRDIPPPTIYGEEIDNPGEAWVTDGWFEPSQGVWQDDDTFKDSPGKRLTKAGPGRWTAELKMVANRPTLLFGIREDGRNRIKMQGKTTFTKLVRVKFRFKLIQGGKETIIWTQPRAENSVELDGQAGAEQPWAASLMASTGLPPSRSFTLDPGSYRIEAELLRENGTPTGLKVVVGGNSVTTSFPTVNFVPVVLQPTAPAARGSLMRAARKLAQGTQDLLPRLFPLPRGSVRTPVQPIYNFSHREPGTLAKLWSKLPGTTPTDRLRRDSLVSRLSQLFSTAAGLGGGKVMAVLNSADFDMTRAESGAAAYAPSQKVAVLRESNLRMTVAHELIHQIPYVWSRSQMAATFGFSWHNEDTNYADGVDIWSGGTRIMKRKVDPTMGPQGGDWITQGSYYHLVEQLQSGIDPDLLLLRGYVARHEGRTYGVLGPGFQLRGEADLEAGDLGPEDFGIVVRDRGGQELGPYRLPLSWVIPDMTEERDLLDFAYTVPQPEGLQAVELIGPDGLLDSREASANAPEITLISPADGALVEPAATLRVEWEASDADGDELTYMALYSPDNGDTWRLVGYELEESTFDLPLRGLPTGPRVRLLASDGLLSASDEVAFTLAR